MRCVELLREKEEVRERERERERPRILKFRSGFLLHAKDNGVCAANSDSSISFTYSFQSVLDLEEMAIRREDGDRSVVTSHGNSLALSSLLNPNLRAGEGTLILSSVICICSVCMNVCLYVCMYICVYACTYVYMYAGTYICVCAYVRRYVCMYVYFGNLYLSCMMYAFMCVCMDCTYSSVICNCLVCMYVCR